MVLKELELTNFRLHKSSKINFSEKLNYIVGGNGQGKTTILEAVYYLCTTKNLLSSSESEIVSFDEDFFEAKGKFKELTEDQSKVLYQKDINKKLFYLNDKQVFRSSAVIGKFPIVTLTQPDHAITQGAPADRRKFVDMVISQTSETYLKILIEYNKILKQRSRLLIQIFETKNYSLLQQLDSWTEMLIDNGAELIKHRSSFISDFNGYLENAYTRILEKREIPFVDYDYKAGDSIESIRADLAEMIENQKDEELRRCANLVGPHRDDFVFHINGLELKKYGSQGQHKTFQIALKFAQFFYMKEKLSRTPVFLLDDVFGELDSYRAEKISDYLREVGQAFITLTDFTRFEKLNVNESNTLLTVNNGSIQYAAKN
jgi:DNA replication and repair protein RecF